jgi:molecular chaperone Hsp33
VTIEMTDKLHRFIFDNVAIRGEWLQLQQAWQAVLIRRDYPLAIQRALGDMIAAAALLADTVKIKGRIVLQIKGDGPASLLMAECTSDNTVRAYGQWSGELKEDASLTEITGKASLAITIEVEGAKQPYQGVVAVEADSLARVLETYFEQSEQLQTRIWLANNSQAVAGLFLQQLPAQQRSETELENWSRISHLASTVSDDELLSLDVEVLLNRLFHEEDCRLLAATELEFACSCSRERVADTIRLVGEAEIMSILEEKGEVEVACEFCNEHYRFDKVDVVELFLQADSKTTLH